MATKNDFSVVVCSRCGHAFRDSIVRRCHDKAVNKYLGEYICIYCCKKCKHHTTHPLCDAIGCKYTERSRISMARAHGS